MFKPLWTTLGLYGVLILAAVPLIAGWVPPNRWYGFRFPGALHSPELWYALNAAGGRNFAAAMAVCIAVNLVLLWKGTPALQRYRVWINAGLIFLSFWLVTLELLDRLP